MNGYELVRMQEYQVDKRGDTMTGDLTVNANTTVNGNLYASEIYGKTFTNLLDRDNNNHGIFHYNYNNGNSLLIFDSTLLPKNAKTRSLGGVNSRWIDLYMQGHIYNDVRDGESRIGFTNGSNFRTYLYGQDDGRVGIWDALNGRPVYAYTYFGGNPIFQIGSHTLPDGGGTYDLGSTTQRWSTVFSNNQMNVSDKNHKENIEYISNNKTKNNKVTYEDMYNFYKNIELATYNFKNKNIVESEDVLSVSKNISESTPINKAEVEGINNLEFGFIAQDIANDKVGSKIAINTKGGYMYSMGSYVSTLAGALKHSINKIDSLEKENKELKDRLKLIEEKLGI